MPFDPRGFAPPIPGVTKTEGVASPEALDPMGRLSMAMGRAPQAPSSIGDKMAQVVQLLREIAQSDPRLAMLTGGALKALTEGPPMGPPPPSMPMGGPGGGPAGPMAAMMGGPRPGGPMPGGGQAGFDRRRR